MMQKMKTKKAQITLFIIVGLVILFIIGAFFYLRTRTTETATDTNIITDDVPPWASPVQEMVSDCVQELAIDAFKKIGEHGGFINFTDTYLPPYSFNMQPQTPTESDVVPLSPDGANPIAYWFYMPTSNDCTNCVVSSLMPSLEFIESEVNLYVNRELPICLNNFEAVKHLGFEVTTKDVSTNTSINIRDVSISVEYP